MFNLFVREKCEKCVKEDLHRVDYYDLSQMGKIHILDELLDDSFEIYYRYNGHIMIFNTITCEYIDENGNGACNLNVFWKGLMEECIGTSLLESVS
jgi:hypothetical protein